MVETRTALYRLYDAAGSLLYVGATFAPRTRMSQHRRIKRWWPMVARTEITWLASKALALEAERWAIDIERPRYNEVGKSTAPLSVEAFHRLSGSFRWDQDDQTPFPRTMSKLPRC